MLKQIASNGEALDLYYDILKQVFKDSTNDKEKKLSKIEEEIAKNIERINIAMQMMLDKEIDRSEYQHIRARYDELNNNLMREKAAKIIVDNNYI